MKRLIQILLILSAPSIAMAEDELPTGTDLAALCQWQSLNYAYLVKIEAYAAAIACTLAIGLGLVTWRMALLSKNQKNLF